MNTPTETGESGGFGNVAKWVYQIPRQCKGADKNGGRMCVRGKKNIRESVLVSKMKKESISHESEMGRRKKR